MEQRSYEAKIKGVWVRCRNLEELDELLERYGSDDDTASESVTPPPVNGQRKNGGGGGGVQASALDTALLKELYAAGANGVKTKRIEGMIGSKGKALRAGLQRWAVRMKLAPDENTFPFENARPEGARGWKLSEGALSGAKLMLGA